MKRERRLRELETAIGDRLLVWFGIRGEDAAALLPLPQFRACFSVTAPLAAAKLAVIDSMEERSRRRVDLDAYDIDLDPSDHATGLRRRMLAWTNQGSIIATYRPSHLLSSIHFANARTTTYLGLFKDRQIAFEHKPWVEMELAKAGVPTMGWRYAADDNRVAAREMLEAGPIVLRASRSSGGAGITLVRSDEDLDAFWPDQADHFVAVSRYLEDAVPVNVGGCIYGSDAISLHPASIQLIGQPTCTNRVFGYCGNDFGAFANLSSSVVADLDRVARTVGRWMASVGYRGAFGVDFLIDGEVVYFCEVNARFQGSTALSVELARAVDEPDIVLDHLAAFLGLEPMPGRSLADWRADLDPAAQVIAHNLAEYPVTRVASTASATPSTLLAELVPAPGIAVDPGGVLFRLRTGDVVTETGFDLLEDVAEAIGSAVRSYVGGSNRAL